MKTSKDKYPLSETAKREEQILEFWDRAKIFKKSVERKAPQGDYVFYDGPPFGTGEPHYGHILSSVAKDVVPRYWTMKGYRVERRWGWDCHGLPIENIIEKDLGISGKKEIEKLGIAKFNEACRSRVLEYADIWDIMVRRIARWVDFRNSYKTMDASYMESVWWAFKQSWQKDLVYEGRKVLLYCPRCETPISNFEVAMDNSYKEIAETSVYVKFKVKSNKFNVDGDVFILAWTTTPWTLPGNVALAVGASIKYLVLSIKGDKDHYIVAKERVEDVFKDKEYAVVKEIEGKELVGLEYEPLFDVPALRESGKKVYYVADADFVTTEDGTGVVHTAVVYGEDDYNLGLKLDLPVVPALDEKGIFNETVPELKGTYFLKANKIVIEKLKERGQLFKPEPITHSYPHCHRCETQLFYNAIPAWFLSIEKLRKDLVKQNENINWYPEHLKEGRFRLGLEQAPDWNISRNRYFATPMPVWRCGQCGEKEIIGSIDELEKKVDLGSFYIMRHGEAESNLKKTLFTKVDQEIHLTGKGRKDVAKAARELKGKDIDLIISSDFLRTKETAQIVAKELGVEISYDEDIREVDVGDYDGHTYDEARDVIEPHRQGEDVQYPNGECWSDVRDRMSRFYNRLRLDYSGKNVLVISHGDPLAALEALLSPNNFFSEIRKMIADGRFIEKGEFRQLRHRITDIHSHFTDVLGWPCSHCDGSMKRIKEVFDCWVESGSMPFAQHHYPFENKQKFEDNFPAQYISEYISQTRAWFYVMHVMSVALFGKNSFENVVTTGVILNEEGKKMSKSKKNYPDPWKVINESGVDALRFYLMSASLMHADNLFFSERELRDVFRKNILLLMNVYKFYGMFSREMTASAKADAKPGDKNILDIWISARLNQLIAEVTAGMDGYDLPRATRPITDFIDDLSTWYLRRSRDRIKGADEADRSDALATLEFVLVQLSKIIAPFMPFMAEWLWQKLTGYDFADDSKSVHLEPWPEADDADEKMLQEMTATRRIVELALAKRDEAGIKVRQPLNKLSVRGPKTIAIKNAYIDLIKDEINVKEVEFRSNGEDMAVALDTELTPELKQEGMKRELVRAINAMRKQAGLTINDRVTVSWQGGQIIADVIGQYESELLADTLSTKIKRSDTEETGKTVDINGESVSLRIEKQDKAE